MQSNNANPNQQANGLKVKTNVKAGPMAGGGGSGGSGSGGSGGLGGTR